MRQVAGGTVNFRRSTWRSMGAAALLVASAAVLAPSAQAQSQIDSREGIALENQILELKQEIQQFQQLQVQAQGQQSALPPPGGDTGAPLQPQGAPNGDLTAQLLVRVNALEEQMRALHGRIEELANTEQRDHDDLAKQIGDMAFKLGQGGAAAAAPGAPPAGGEAPPSANPDPGAGAAAGLDLSIATPPPPPPPTHRTAEVALKLGNAALARRDYPAAEASAREVLAMSHSPHAPDATYLLARALAGEHQYKPAAASFFAVYKASPKSPRGAEGLLGVANAMVGLGDNKDACEATAKFTAEFPHADAPLHQAAASVRRRAQCK